MKNKIYLDYNATAPLRPAARDAMLRVMEEPGNASSTHHFGRQARKYVEIAREQVATLCGTVPSQVTFTSGATESNNAVLKIFTGERILVGATEHPSILESAPNAEKIAVDHNGIIDLNAFEQQLQNGPAPALVSVMMANNETGVIQHIGKLAKRARAIHPNIFFHTDAVQAAGRVLIDMPALRVDYLSLSAHKIGGPQGAGALIVAPGAKPAILIHGGGQEKRQRAGTENAAGIAGFGAAAQDALAEFKIIDAAQRDRLENAILSIEPRAIIAGRDASRLYNTSCIALPGVAAETQLMILDLEGIAVSSGSACSSGTVKASHVLQAMGLSDAATKSALRVSTGWATSDEDIERFIAAWTLMHGRVKDRIQA
jgi:cysteine desulfurase